MAFGRNRRNKAFALSVAVKQQHKSVWVVNRNASASHVTINISDVQMEHLVFKYVLSTTSFKYKYTYL